MGDSALTRQTQELEALIQIGQALTSTLEYRDFLEKMMEEAGRLLGAKRWSLLLLDEATGELRFEIAASEAAERLKGFRLPRGEGIAGWVALHGEPLLIPDVQQDPRFTRQVDEAVHFTTRSIICVPVKCREKVYGVMQLVNSLTEGSFDEADLRILSTIADFAAIAMENARQFERIRQLLITDDLTGLYNCRHFHDLLDYEIDRSRRYDTDLCLVFIDLDHFKNVNDTYGHLAGSRLLAEIGGLLRENVRKADLAARYGGDEFVLLLPSTGKMGALTVAANLRRAIREHRCQGDDGRRFGVTASFGIAAFPADAQDKESLLRVADQKMYQVKETTRDGILAA